MKSLLIVSFIVALVASPVAVSAADPQTFTIRDRTGRGFAPDVVQYDLAGNWADPKSLRVTTGMARPGQPSNMIQYRPSSKRSTR